MALTPAGEQAKQQIIALANLLRTDTKIEEDSPLKFYPEVIYERTLRLSTQIDACADAIVTNLMEALGENGQAEIEEPSSSEE